jgi:RNA recognition motif-containing protein
MALRRTFSSKDRPCTSPAEHNTFQMSFTVFLGNLPVWVTADDIKSWLSSENLVADAIKVIRNPETQESKGFAFIDAPNQEEMNSIIRRFDRAPLEDRLLRANPAQPPKSGKGVTRTAPPVDRARRQPPAANNPPARKSGNDRSPASSQNKQSAFAEELAKAL